MDDCPARLSPTERYRLRLLGHCNRHYVTDKGLGNLAMLGLVAPTGRRNEAGRAEWTITEAGRAALASEGILPRRRDEQARHAVFRESEMITGPQLRAARAALGWKLRVLATKAKLPSGVVERAENSPGEPAITIAQLSALMQALRAAGASFPPADPQPDGNEDLP